MNAATSQGQRGYILIAVAAIGTVATMVMSSVFNGGVIQEQRAVENRLAETRAYWAVMGHFRYGLSRIRRQKLCDQFGSCGVDDNVKDTDMGLILTSHLNEISARRVFTYPEENAGYHIDIGMAAIADDTPGRHTYSGHLLMRSSFPNTQSTLPVLSGLATRFRPYELRFCVGVTNVNNPCGPLTVNNDPQINGLYRIKRLARL
jgi:hypothetical protein